MMRTPPRIDSALGGPHFCHFFGFSPFPKLRQSGPPDVFRVHFYSGTLPNGTLYGSMIWVEKIWGSGVMVGVLGNLDDSHDMNKIIQSSASKGKGIALRLRTRMYSQLQNTNPIPQPYRRARFTSTRLRLSRTAH